jgi:hypothetical protein
MLDTVMFDGSSCFLDIKYEDEFMLTPKGVVMRIEAESCKWQSS